jgi:hypothetical protein
MFDFLKTFGQGLLYIILSPFILILVAVYTIYCVFLFIYMFIKRVVMFFLGYNMKDELPIDKIAKMHMKEVEEEANKPTTPAPVEQTPVQPQQTIYQQFIVMPNQNGGFTPINLPNGFEIKPVENTQTPQIENQVIDQIEESEKEEDSDE